MRMVAVNRRGLDGLSVESSLADASRVLQVDLLHARTLGWPAVDESLERALSVLEAAFDDSAGKFRTDLDGDGTWITDASYNDAAPLAMLALGEASVALPDPALGDRAMALFAQALPMTARIAAPRSQATLVLACDAIIRSPRAKAFPSGRGALLAAESEAVMRRLATGLHATFLWSAAPGWPWLESSVGPNSAVVPQALIVAGDRLGAPVMRNIGLQVLDWLLENQTSPAGQLSPIGADGWPRNGERPKHPQLPIDATGLLLAARAALEATGADRYRDAMERAYAWFLGQNDRRRKLVDTTRGTCTDGLTATGVDRAGSAASSLLWLIAAEQIRAARADAVHAAATLAATPVAPVRPTEIRARTATIISAR